jgi:hypothetical protein
MELSEVFPENTLVQVRKKTGIKVRKELGKILKEKKKRRGVASEERTCALGSAQVSL